MRERATERLMQANDPPRLSRGLGCRGCRKRRKGMNEVKNLTGPTDLCIMACFSMSVAEMSWAAALPPLLC